MKIKEGFSYFGKKLQRLCSRLSLKVTCYFRPTCFLISCFYSHFRLHLNSLSIHLIYFISISFLGFWSLKVLKPRSAGTFNPRNLDLFFTSVSAATVSSMSTVEMEVFSNTQLLILVLLMFIGGGVFTSMVELQIRRFNLRRIIRNTERKLDSSSTGIINPSSSPPNSLEHIELGIVVTGVDSPARLKYNSIKLLSFVVMGYLLIINFVGVALVSVYLTLVSSARNVLKKKGLKLFTFSLFTVVSTFANCGFVPTNENMMVFSKNSGLLLILIPQVLLGNTLFPPFLRFSIWFLGKFVKKVGPSSDYLLTKTEEIGYPHLLPGLHSSLLVGTVVGFVAVQFTLFCSMEWDSVALSGLSSYEKVVGALFESVNSRHSGETIVDLSTIASAILVLFVVMMYLPPYTSFLPIKDDDEQSLERKRKRKRRGKKVENIIFSQLSYLVIFIILVCIIERKKMMEDPLNFNVLNIVVEVISAYGNVGFSIGYSCERQLKPDGNCTDKWYGFVGKWSNGGKIILIIVMFFGRMKKFNMNGGKAWKLL